MKVLVACECSQTVTIAFRLLGHEAYSCDLQPCYGNHPEWHIQDDVLKHLNSSWDLLIAHPPCTYLSCVGNRWFNIERYKDKALKRFKLQEDAARFFMEFVNAPIDKICIENPKGVMSRLYRPPDQIISPYEFGDPYQKLTCLWLKNLNPLICSYEVVPEDRIYFKSGKSLPAWYAAASNLSPIERSNARSKTFPGIAKAMSLQWSENPVYLF